jgi:hypothetical protein
MRFSIDYPPGTQIIGPRQAWDGAAAEFDFAPDAALTVVRPTPRYPRDARMQELPEELVRQAMRLPEEKDTTQSQLVLDGQSFLAVSYTDEDNVGKLGRKTEIYELGGDVHIYIGIKPYDPAAEDRDGASISQMLSSLRFGK